MNGYKILIVEDNLGELAQSYYPLFFQEEVAGEGSLEEDLGKNHLTATEKESKLRALGYVDYAKDTLEALEILEKSADQYLLMLVDRDLSRSKESRDDISAPSFIEGLKRFWPEYNGLQREQGEFYGGDFLLEFLCLKKGMVDLCRNRFRFLTHNADNHLPELQSFLTALHFSYELVGPPGAPGRMIVPKETDHENFRMLRRRIMEQPTLYIWKKYKEVFPALVESYAEMEISQEEHVQNMIKALAYVEGVKLDWKYLERPSISLLRALGEAFRARVKKLANDDYNSLGPWKVEPTNFFKQLRNELATSEGIIKTGLLACMANKSPVDENNRDNAWSNGRPLFDIVQLDELELFKPVTNPTFRNAKGNKIAKLDSDQRTKLEKHQRRYQHISSQMELLKHLASQEIHHNDRKRCEGDRLKLIVYSVCELLRFYPKLSGEPIEIKPRDIERAKVLDVMYFLIQKDHKGKSGWAKVDQLEKFKEFLHVDKNPIDISVKGLRNMDFEVEGAFFRDARR